VTLEGMDGIGHELHGSRGQRGMDGIGHGLHGSRGQRLHGSRGVCGKVFTGFLKIYDKWQNLDLKI